jgi:tetratricopeptide (TPR) repeat protein
MCRSAREYFMMSRNRVAVPAASLLCVGLSLAVAGCSQIEGLKAKKAFKEANALYTAQEYRKAAVKYEEVIQLSPEETKAVFFLANSYDNLYKPTRKGEKENDEYLEKAITLYTKSAEIEKDPTFKKRALEFLISAYGVEKANDPQKAEPIISRMIELEPNEPTNYFILAKLHEDAGEYEKAEATLIKVRDLRPDDPQTYLQLAGYYNRQGDFEKTMENFEKRAEKEPTNPEAFHTIGSYYWEKAYKDFRIKEPQKKEFIMKGLEAENKALAVRGDYLEAVTYKNLLLRLQANMEKDPKKQQALIKEADELRQKAIELQKKRTAGVG